MSHAYSSTQAGSPQAGAATEALSTVVYRSRAVSPLSARQLYDLALAAQIRNRRDAITGVVLYDNDRFFQWLEGPTENVERIMRDIRNDPRHTDLEVLDDHPCLARIFGDWDMKLAARGPRAPVWQRDVLEPPMEIVEFLRDRPDSAPAVLVKLVPLPSSAPETSDPMAKAAMTGKTAAVLKGVLLTKVIPALMQQRGLAPTRQHSRPVSARVAELAELLVASDETAARALIQEISAGASSVFPLYASLFEPAARSLGDLWGEDACSEFDVTLGLCRMQTAIRLLSTNALGRSARHSVAPAVLIAPEPGELHRLGAAMDSEVLWNAGWVPRCEYPADDKALEDLVSGTWFDVLDLSLSAAFRREHWLPRVAATIQRAKHASKNPALIIIVGGRVFQEEVTAGGTVGADTSSRTALDIQRLIADSVREAV
jgi:methanogenic corrinoid protein MtbC1